MCTLYRSPHFNEFFEKLSDAAEHIKTTSNFCGILLLGDLNTDFQTTNWRKLTEFCSNHNFTCHIDHPTYFDGNKASCLDQILTNVPNFVLNTSISPPVSVNDHSTVGVKLKFSIASEK